MIVQTDVAYVRLDDGSVVKLAGGDEVPADAAADHVAGLKAAGVLASEPPATPEGDPPAGGSPSSGSPAGGVKAKRGQSS